MRGSAERIYYELLHLQIANTPLPSRELVGFDQTPESGTLDNLLNRNFHHLDFDTIRLQGDSLCQDL
jgi:hypothetical protein